MGVIVEFYAVPSALAAAPAGIDLAYARQYGLQVAAISLNSAALGIFLAWLPKPPLARIFGDPDGAGQGVLVQVGQVPGLTALPPGPPETEDFVLALEHAVDEATWRNEALWIGSA